MKNVPLEDCTLLHFAIAEHDHEGLKKLLEDRADLSHKARYMKTYPDAVVEVMVEAVHIAVACNNQFALEQLLDAYEKSEEGQQVQEGCEYLRRYTQIAEVEGVGRNFQDFYQPIHDAGFMGHKDITMWLLKKNVEVNALNKDGVTPLHWAAMRGGRAGLSVPKDVEDLVEELLKRRADLNLMTKKVKPNPLAEEYVGKTVFELARQNERFPVASLVQLHEASQKQVGFLDRLSWYVQRNMPDEAVLYIEEKLQNSTELNSLLKEVQFAGKVNELATVLFRAPWAATRLLDFLTMSPKVQDCLPARAWLNFGPMKCTYQADSTKVSLELPENSTGFPDTILWPQWTSGFSVTAGGSGKEPAWHKDFFPSGQEPPLRADYVYPVDVKVVMVPDILDVDICMALTRTWASDLEIFAHLPIQGLVCCWWNSVVHRSFLLNLGFMVVELMALLYWGLAVKAAVPSASSALEDSHDFHEDQAPVCWFALLVGLWREMLILLLWVLTHFMKYWSYQEGNILKVLWDPWTFVTPHYDSWFIGTFMFACARLFFLWITSGGHAGHWDEAMLAGSAFLQILRTFFMLRLTHPCKGIIPIVKTFASRANMEMLVLAAMLFTAFAVTFQMHFRNINPNFTATYLYRGLMFGDGEGLDRMGLKACKNETGNETNGTETEDCTREVLRYSWPLSLAMFSATIIFNIAVVNLMTAIYSSKYEEIKCHRDLHFQLERAKHSLVQLQLVQLQDQLRHHPQRWSILVSALVVLVAVLPLLPPLAVKLLLSLLLAVLQVSFQGLCGQANWKHEAPEAETSSESELEERRFLWICHRKDFDPMYFDQDPVSRRDLEDTNKRLGRLEEKLEKHVPRSAGASESAASSSAPAPASTASQGARDSQAGSS